MPLWVCLALLAVSLVGAFVVYRDDISYFIGTDRDQEDAAARAHEQMNARMVKR
jgi:hypothetical protein